jgi:hypothetical protein
MTSDRSVGAVGSARQVVEEEGFKRVCESRLAIEARLVTTLE